MVFRPSSLALRVGVGIIEEYPKDCALSAGNATFWLVDDHALRKLRDVPPLLPSLGQKHTACRNRARSFKEGLIWAKQEICCVMRLVDRACFGTPYVGHVS